MTVRPTAHRAAISITEEYVSSVAQTVVDHFAALSAENAETADEEIATFVNMLLTIIETDLNDAISASKKD